VFGTEDTVALPADMASMLDGFVAGGEFFSYAGSETLPPCGKAQWLVRRNTNQDAAVNDVIAKLDTALNEMSNEVGGNYRDVMPSNARVVDVVKAVRLGLTPKEVEDRKK